MTKLLNPKVSRRITEKAGFELCYYRGGINSYWYVWDEETTLSETVDYRLYDNCLAYAISCLTKAVKEEKSYIAAFCGSKDSALHLGS